MRDDATLRRPKWRGYDGLVHHGYRWKAIAGATRPYANVAACFGGQDAEVAATVELEVEVTCLACLAEP